MTRHNILTVEEYLREHGPALSSEVSAFFQDQGLSAPTARKRIERATGNIKWLYRLGLPHRQRFLYLEEQFGTDAFSQRFIESMDKIRSVFGYALFGLEARGGIIPRSYFPIISGTPQKIRGHLSPEVVLAILEHLGAVYPLSNDDVGPCIQFAWAEQPSTIAKMKARLAVEDVLADAVTEWLRKLGFVSYDAVKTRALTQQPEYASVAFDIVGPSYISPLMTFRKGKSVGGFLAADIFINDLQERDIRYFVHKFGILRSRRQLRPLIPMLVAGRFSPEAMRALKTAGILCPTITNLFGGDIFDALVKLLRTLENAAAVAARSPDQIYTLFSKLGSFEGALGRMRGAMFELVVGHAVQAERTGVMEIGKYIRDPNNGDGAEVDVFHMHGTEVACYECKGYGPQHPVTFEEVKRWSETRIPLIREWLAANSVLAKYRQSFAFWTSSTFEPHALTYLQARWSNTRKFKVTWKAGNEVAEYADLYASPAIAKVLREFYLKQRG